jgi:hypothetical protein
MSKNTHISYRGAHIDIEALRNENAHVPAIGNMNVNAKGDVLGRGGVIAKTVDEIARENRRVHTPVKHTGLKGPIPESVAIDPPKPAENSSSATGPAMKPRKEKVADNRDIIVDGEE